MANLISIDVDPSGAIAALNRLGAAVERRLMAVAKITAESIAREAASRLRRQTGPNATGQTADSITAEPAKDGQGYVVYTKTPADRFSNIDIVLEYGTKFMTPRPFLHASVALEEGPHRRRLEQAIHDAIDEAEGLG